MPNSVNIFVYLGSGEIGEELENLIQREAKKRGFIKKNGEANISPFVVHCIKYTIAHEKK
jgi:hypothetical protein